MKHTTCLTRKALLKVYISNKKTQRNLAFKIPDLAVANTRGSNQGCFSIRLPTAFLRCNRSKEKHNYLSSEASSDGRLSSARSRLFPTSLNPESSKVPIIAGYLRQTWQKSWHNISSFKATCPKCGQIVNGLFCVLAPATVSREYCYDNIRNSYTCSLG